MNRTEQVALYRKAHALNARARRNQGKIAWLCLTEHPQADVQFGDQLARHFAEADEANRAWVASVEGLSADEIVAIISEAA